MSGSLHRLGGALLFGGLTSTTLGLGIWQTNRYMEAIHKEKDDTQQQQAAEVKDLDVTRMVVIGPRKPPPDVIGNKPMGFYVYVPGKQVQNGQAVAVCLGWTTILGWDRNSLLSSREERIKKLMDKNDELKTTVWCTPGETEHGNWFSPVNPVGQGMLLWTSKPDLTRELDIPAMATVMNVQTPTIRDFVPRPSHGSGWLNPNVHAGYAFTWFTLTLAGMMMTRKLLRVPPPRDGLKRNY